MSIRWGALAGALILLTACDAIRYPGQDNDDTYEPEIPPGAPGPAPPSEPVDDPYNNGDTAESDETPDVVLPPVDETPDDAVTPDTDPETDTPTDADADADADAVTDSGTDVTDNPSDSESDIETPADTPESDTTTDAPTEDTSDTDASTPDMSDSDTAETETGEDTDQPTDVADTPTDPEPEPAVVFSYIEPGQLLPGSGTGAQDRNTVFAPDMRFPIKSAPTYAQSMVWTFGGGIGGGDQCDRRNYEYPWQDNFCETRSANRNSAYCPVSRIHQGQDLRVGTPTGCNEMRGTPASERGMYEVVATEDGIIQSIGTYTVTLRAGPRIYKYMHMNMDRLQVSTGESVSRGQTLGYVSNDFGGTPTVYHLHFEILQNTAESGWVHVPPYTSLVAAYEDREGGIGEEIEANVGIASAPPEIPEGFVIIE